MNSQPHPAPHPPARSRILLPKAPVLVMDGRKLFCLTPDGEIRRVDDDEARRIVHEAPIVCHAPALARRLNLARLPAHDVLELFAFVHPGKFCVPTPGGLARALNLLEPAGPEDACAALRDAARHLLADLSLPGREEKSNPAALAALMGLEDGGGWPWAPAVLSALGRLDNPPQSGEIKVAMKVWEKLPEWAVHAPPASPGHMGVTEEEARDRLHRLLQRQHKEDRPQQADYAAAIRSAFAPVNEEGETQVVMAEAGTGVGKTLGYLAPATVWAEKNGGAVWVSTYTRNLQKQVDAELDRLYEDPVEKSRRVVTRKGRENYLCLLNLEDASQSPSIRANAPNAVALGLMLRWAAVTADGDLAGKDFPGWLPGLIGQGRAASFADRRGECIYSACPHFDRCFVEKSVRKAKRADIVIANHALVMNQTADSFDAALPARYVFDEGHHLFDAADSAFAAHLCGSEAAELRRWILGVEGQGKSRARGVRRRLEDLVVDDDAAKKALDELIEAARALPGPEWRKRVASGETKGAAEKFLLLCRKQVLARNPDAPGSYSLEAEPRPPIPELPEAARALATRLKDIQRPMLALATVLENKLTDEAETLDTAARERLRFLANSLGRRGRDMAGAWVEMLAALERVPEEGVFVDWLEITRIEGIEHDVGLYRHYVDPAAVFAAALKVHAQGIAVTSATLRDTSNDDPEGWQSGRIRAGVAQLDPVGTSTRLFEVKSPFDYAAQTRVIVVTDVKKENTDEVASAFRALFAAAGGGALGLFTAVQRLKAVHQRLLGPLEEKGIHLYAQHTDGLDTATLIDIFRAEEDACLLGTDAARDGIDVPGRSLRLVVYDRVPWPRPDILHKARRASFGKGYDDMLTRFKLKQAYGRLIRRADDRGVFVMLDAALPTRLLSAFPDGVEVQRVGLKDAIQIIRDVL
jgi:ATP-dependent DNA helicase DinG